MVLVLTAALVAAGVAGVRAVAGWVAGLGQGSQGGPVSAEAATGPAPLPADTTGFDPTYLIDDTVFYDSSAMTHEEVSSLIERVNAGCQSGADGTACLAQARFDVEPREPSLTCPGRLDAAQDASAADVIWAVSQACDVNPQVLVALIHKEQGLLTASGLGLTSRRYEAAAGYACPDGAACDPAWSGFVNQLYGAASQFQRYRLQPGGFRVQAGVPVTLGYSPDPACGAGELTAANQATAGLYNYTPYLANEAVTSGSGGDDCSNFGAWNFYGFFRTLFGDPTPSRG